MFIRLKLNNKVKSNIGKYQDKNVNSYLIVLINSSGILSEKYLKSFTRLLLK